MGFHFSHILVDELPVLKDFVSDHISHFGIALGVGIVWHCIMVEEYVLSGVVSLVDVEKLPIRASETILTPLLVIILDDKSGFLF